MTTRARILNGDMRGMTKAALAIAIVAILLLSGATYFSYTKWFAEDDTEDDVPVVEDGDKVTCDYVGLFTDGRVFDTSISDVAYNNATYPKSLQFQLRPSNGYTPYEFTVGSGTTIQGWQDAVLGMSVGQTKVVKIPASEAYGASDEAKIVRSNLTFDVPMYVTQNLDVFSQIYGGIPTAPGALFTHLDFMWPCEIVWVDNASSLIRYRHSPELFSLYTIYGEANWNIKVLDIDQSAGLDGRIVCEHQLNPSDANKIIVTEDDGDQFIVTEVNADEGYFVKDYNREVVGKTLIFKITIKSITKATE